ncbi:hypothetical protein [Micromonospora sp. NPDC000668]|uniref:hypothetical protein n=1 Tax=Micromonospora sp. NPDC000668 TaxID=3364219 RepID=UPI0036CAA020
MGTNPEAAMDFVPDATAISSLVDLLGGVLQLTAAVVTLLAAVSVRGAAQVMVGETMTTLVLETQRRWSTRPARTPLRSSNRA